MDGDGCPNVERCELFPKLQETGALSYCLYKYCYADYHECARYQFSRAHGKRPPLHLLPHGNAGGGADEP